MQTEEYHMFKCWRYKINTHITYYYDDGVLTRVRCSLKDDHVKKCDGFQSPGYECPLLAGHSIQKSPPIPQ